ncbi:MAG: glycoside hydrolase family 95 protein [Ferruginibacter sp.]
MKINYPQIVLKRVECKITKLSVLILFGTAFSQTSFTQEVITGDLSYASKMWYGKPSVNWNEALPIGNGRLGAMVYGGVKSDYIPLNEQTLWSGAGPRTWNNPNGKKYLPLVRQAALEGNYKRADSLSKFMQGPYTESYMPMADLLISYSNLEDSSSYTRTLNLDSAVSTISFVSKNITYTRTAFSSFPDQVIVIRHSSDKKGNISFEAGLTSKLHFTVYTISDHHIVLKGKCPKHVEPQYLWRLKGDQAVQYDEDENGEGMNFEVHLLIKNESGKIRLANKNIIVENADAATIIISAATSYNGYLKSPGKEGKDPAIDAVKYLTAAAAKSYKVLLQRHISDYKSIYQRVYVNLGESKNSDLPTDERLKQMSTYTDPELVATVAQYGRYLLIAGSRPGGQPVNLKGIWNDKVRPEYSSNWCIDHDAQMFYYAVETNNLSEMHEPFLNFIEGLAKNGRATARINYGMRGWCAHHNTDIWRSTGASGNYGEGNPHWATWNMSAPWLCAHFFEHYLFTGDKIFLREKAWPVMKGAAEFCLDWLVKNKEGKFISVPSVSPENTFITEKGDTAQVSVNTTGDISLMKELFSNCVRTAAILKIESAFTLQLKKALAGLMPYPTGSKGQLLEWSGGEWKAVDPGHRHLTHMYPVFPGNEISPFTTPQLSDAAKIALTLREKTNGTWGFALKAACWARLGEGDSAWKTWQYQLQYFDPVTAPADGNLYGLFPNLFNSEGRQAVILNGNGCATAVLTEMLVQSHAGAIDFLPALPKVFPAGILKGICARGGFIVDLKWSNYIMVNAAIYSKSGNDCRIRMNRPFKVFNNGREIAVKEISKNIYSFKTRKGKKYAIRLQ